MQCLWKLEDGVRLLGLEFLATMYCHVGTLGFNPRLERVLDHWSIAPAPSIHFFLSRKLLCDPKHIGTKIINTNQVFINNCKIYFKVII